METNRLSKKGKLTVHEAVGFFLLTELVFFRKLVLTTFDLDVLTLLVSQGKATSLPDFCDLAARRLYPDCAPEDLATRKQNVRNRLVKLERRELVVKSFEKARTLVSPIPALAIPLDKPLHLDYQFLGHAPH